MKFENCILEKTSEVEEIKNILLDRIKKSEIYFESDYLRKKIIEAIKISGYHNYESRYGNIDGTFTLNELEKANEKDSELMVRYIEYRYKFKNYPNKHIVNQFPLVLAIEPSKACNLKCIMCFQSNPDFKIEDGSNGIMTMDTYEKIMDEASKYKLPAIVLASRGEPLLNPNIDKMISRASEAGVIDIKMNTNALLLDEDMSRRLLKTSLHSLVFSVDAINEQDYKKIRGGDFNKVINNINRFNEIRKKEFPDSKLRTRTAVVLVNSVERKESIEEIKSYWKGKVDEISIKTENDFKGVYDDNSIEEKKPCSLLWERFYIWHDGVINPCDIDYKSKLNCGNINETTIKEAWNGEYMTRLREKHKRKNKSMYPCNNCIGY
ncbi:radical SAM protein [Vallitalea sediminicola]